MKNGEHQSERPVPLEWERVFNSINDAVWIMDGARKVRWANAAAEAVFGRPSRKAEGAHCYELVHGSAGPLPDCPFDKACRSLRRETKEVEAKGRIFEAVIDPIIDEAGRFAGAAHILSEITGRRRLESELKAKKEEMRDFLLITSHDIRTPLICIQGYAEFLQNDLKKLISILGKKDMTEGSRFTALELARGMAAESLEPVLESAAQIEQLVRSVIKVAKLGRIEMKPEKLDVNSLIAEMLPAFAFQAQAAGAEIEAGRLPQCTADAATLKHIFANLLGNALNFPAEGRKLRITLQGRKSGGTVVFSVSDNGSGIRKDDMPEIWKLFYSRHPAGRKKSQGIGLPMARMMAEANGGRMWAESEAGRGSVFYVEMPA